MNFTVIAAVIGLIAYGYGNHLFGMTGGVVYAAVALALVWLLARSLRFREGVSVLRVVVVLLFTAAVGFWMAFPASIDWRVQHVIEQHAIDRDAKRELLTLFGTDPAFRGLSVSSVQLKRANLSVHGSLASRVDFDRLRLRISDECPAIGEWPLLWDIVLRDSGTRVEGIEERESP